MRAGHKLINEVLITQVVFPHRLHRPSILEEPAAGVETIRLSPEQCHPFPLLRRLTLRAISCACASAQVSAALPGWPSISIRYDNGILNLGSKGESSPRPP